MKSVAALRERARASVSRESAAIRRGRKRRKLFARKVVEASKRASEDALSDVASERACSTS